MRKSFTFASRALFCAATFLCFVLEETGTATEQSPESDVRHLGRIDAGLSRIDVVRRRRRRMS